MCFVWRWSRRSILTAHKEGYPAILDIELKTHGELGHLLQVGLEGGSAEPFVVGQKVSEKYFIHMNGREVFKHAVRGMSDLTSHILEKKQLKSYRCLPIYTSPGQLQDN